MGVGKEPCPGQIGSAGHPSLPVPPPPSKWKTIGGKAAGREQRTQAELSVDTSGLDHGELPEPTDFLPSPWLPGDCLRSQLKGSVETAVSL